jgi:hypothetical protein
MAEHSTVFTGPDTQEAFLADREQFLHGFTRFTLGMVILVVLVLVLMAVFLL